MEPLALIGVEVLGFTKTLEEIPGVLVVEDGVMPRSVFVVERF